MSDAKRADRVYAELLKRQGEQWVEPRIERTRRVLELMDDPQKTYRVIHITGTNGKTSTARVMESLVRAHGLRTGLFTSPHLTRFTERMMVDGEPADDGAVADAWDEILPFVNFVDEELVAAGDARLTFFELMTVLAFVVFSDAPVDVAIIEVGMGGEWDSTNTADGDVAVFTPIDLDHMSRLGNTVEEIATVKAGIIKDGAAVVSARQLPAVEAILRAKASEHGASIIFEGSEFALVSQRLAVGGQQISVRGITRSYDDEYLPLFGAHQGFNAALAIASVESLIGGGTVPIAEDIVAEGLQEATSPGRLQLLGIDPTVLVDAGHNPHGARALAVALKDSFDFDEWALVLGVLDDKDAVGIVDALKEIPAHVFATAPTSERAAEVDRVADIAEMAGLRVTAHGSLDDAAEAAREWASEQPRRAVIIVGSVVLAGEAILLSEEQEWKSGWSAR